MILTELLWLRHMRVVSLETINLIAIWPGTCWHNVFFMISLVILRSGFSATGNRSWRQIHWKKCCFTESVCSWVPQGLSALNEQLQEPSSEEDHCLYKWYTCSVFWELKGYTWGRMTPYICGSHVCIYIWTELWAEGSCWPSICCPQHGLVDGPSQ